MADTRRLNLPRRALRMERWRSRMSSMGKMIAAVAVCLLMLACRGPESHTYFVSQDGSDSDPGTLKRAFGTIQKAASVMRPSDTCYIRGGTYRETVQPTVSGLERKPIRFEAYQDEKVILDGTEQIKGPWERHQENIYKTKVPALFEQLFCDGTMMVEARWPNMSFPDQLWETECWAESGTGSRYGKMVDPELAATGIGWTGAIAVLNVAHQFRTWTRKVLEHEEGSDTFTYKKDLNPITSYAEKTRQWEDDYYYLCGKLEALDAPGEWHLDRDALELYLWCPDSDPPAGHEIAYKVRKHAFKAQGKEYLELSGIHFMGTTLSLADCNNCVIENCSFIYPDYSREFNDPSGVANPAETLISGTQNTVRDNYVTLAQVTGLTVRGSENLVENNIIHDVAWTGQGFAIHLTTTNMLGNVVTRNTAYNTGYSVFRLSEQGNWEVSYNHLHHSALRAKDCAVIQTGGWDIAGSVIHHNWVHDCYAAGNHPGGLKGGLGIRGDDQTRELTVHNNVVWNCGRDGIIVKGDKNKVFNNTVFNIGSNGLEGNYISMHTEKEPYKPWRFQIPLLEVQNLNSRVINNAAMNISGDRKRTPFTPEENLVTNFSGEALMITDPEDFDFTPAPGSPLIDAGTHIPGLTDGYRGKAPDIGAYEVGDTWKAGADWQPRAGLSRPALRQKSNK